MDDRRLFDRFSAQFPAKFKDTRDDFGTKVFLRNVSAQGAQFISADHLYIGDSVTLEVEIPDGLNPIQLRGEVTWIKRLEAPYWDVGIKFYGVQLMRMARVYKAAEVAH